MSDKQIQTAAPQALLQAGMTADLETIIAALDSVVPIFVLIDPMLGEPIAMLGIEPGVDPQPIREKAWQRGVVQIALAERCTLPPHQHPYLVALSGPHDPLLELTLELAQDERRAAMADGLDGTGKGVHHIGGWLQSGMHAEQLAARLGSLMRVNTSAITTATYLRLADRRALAMLRHVVGDQRVVAQFGRLQSWIYLDAHGRLATLRSVDEEAVALRLDRKEWLAMEDGEALNRSLAQWLGEAERIGDRGPLQIPAQGLYSPLKNALANARQAMQRWPHRFPKLADQTAWCALVLLNPALPANAAVNTLLDQTGTDDEPVEPFRSCHRDVSALLQAGTAAARR